MNVSPINVVRLAGVTLAIGAGLTIGCDLKLPTGVTVSSVALTPDSVLVDTVATAQFSVVATLSDNTTQTLMGAVFSATGGTINSSGVYTSGRTNGVFRVVAADSTGMYADTSKVVIQGAGGVPTATKVTVTSQPTSGTLGTVLTPALVVQLRNASDNAVSQNGVAVNVALASGPGTLGGTLSQNTNASGVATFSNLLINGTTGSYTIAVSSTGLTGATTAAIVMSAPGTGPTLTAISRAAGSTAGGLTVRLTGTGFLVGAAVNFGATAATGITIISGTTLDAVVPAGNAGAVNVSVVQGGVTTTLPNAFTYFPARTVTYATSDFESGALAPFVTSATATVSTDQARSGVRSVKQTFAMSADNGPSLGYNFGNNNPPVSSANGMYLRWFFYVPAATKISLDAGGASQIKMHLGRYYTSGGWAELAIGGIVGAGNVRMVGDQEPGNPTIGSTGTLVPNTWTEVVIWYSRNPVTQIGTISWWMGTGGNLAFMGTRNSASYGRDSATEHAGVSIGAYSQLAATYPITVYEDDFTIANGWIDP